MCLYNKGSAYYILNKLLVLKQIIVCQQLRLTRGKCKCFAANEEGQLWYHYLGIYLDNFKNCKIGRPNL